MDQENQTPHKRRVRYKGKYPKKFEEKYKELQPEKYQDTIQHVIQKGNTPAGMHISIMVQEILDFLQIQPGQVGFDATLGYGGHTKAMLACLKGQGHMYATDVDPEESAKTRKRLEEAGYITREKHPDCRRSFLIVLTKEGRNRAAQVYEDFRLIDERIWQGFTEEEMAVFLSCAKKIIGNLKSETEKTPESPGN